MGKLNEIQDEKTQSWGSNSFTTTVKEDTVEFDSAKDKFTFKDEVEVPSLKVNGESVGAQVQSDWNQADTEAPDYIKNKPEIPTPVPQVQSDWNQNDNTAADYIKNRICYEETETVTFCSTTFDENGSISNYYQQTDVPMTAGVEYTAIVGDNEEVVQFQLYPEDGALVGGIYLAQGGGQVGYMLGNIVLNISSNRDLYATKTFKVVGAETSITKIDQKFLPSNEDESYVEDSDSNSFSAYHNKFNYCNYAFIGGHKTDTVDLVVTDDMKVASTMENPSKTYVFKGIITLDSATYTPSTITYTMNGLTPSSLSVQKWCIEGSYNSIGRFPCVYFEVTFFYVNENYQVAYVKEFYSASYVNA